MTVRTSVSLYVLETALHLVGAAPAALAVAAATASLPPAMTLLGGQGAPTIIDVALLSGPAVPIAAIVSAGLLALAFLLASPLLLAGTIRTLAGSGPADPWRLLARGARRYPRFLLLHVAFLGLCAGGSVLLVWSAGPLWGAFASLGLVATFTILRDAVAVSLGREARIRDGLARVAALARLRHLPVLAAAVIQFAAALLLVLLAVRLQLEMHAETVIRAVILGLLVQGLVLARCLVRCAWLGALVRHDS